MHLGGDLHATTTTTTMIYADLNFMEEKETTGRGRQSQVARGLEGGADAGLATRGAGGTGTGTGTGKTTNGAEDGSRSSDEETFVDDVTANGGQGGAGAIGARGGGVGRRAPAPAPQQARGGVKMIVVRQDYDDDTGASGGNEDALAAKKKALREKERLRSLRRRLVQTEAQRAAERDRSRRRRLAMTEEQKKAAAEAKMRRRCAMRQAKEAIAAATVLAMNLHGENA